MSKASRLKGLCNRLITIFELPAHQAKNLVALFPGLRKGGFADRMLDCFLLAVFPLSSLRMPPVFAAVSSPANAALNPTLTSLVPY